MKKFRYCLLLIAVVALCAGVFAACDGKEATVSLDANGGTCSVQTVSAQVGKKLSPVPAAEKEGCVFEGWYKSASGGERWNFDVDKVSGDMTLYAGFRAQASDFVGVTYDVGTGAEEAPKSRDVRKGNLLPAPSDPVRKGYRFEGWYKDEECTREWNFESDTVESALKLYAKWTKVHTVEIMRGEDKIASVVYEDGAALKNNLPVINGLVYSGLYEDAEFKTEVSQSAAVKGDAKYYARYEQPTPADKFEYEKGYGQIRIKGLKDGFDGDEVVIPEIISDTPVRQVDLNTQKALKRVVISASVSHFNISNEPENLVISPANDNFAAYDGCIYTKSPYDTGIRYYLYRIPENKRFVNVMPGGYLASIYNVEDKIFLLSDAASAHADDDISNKRLIVPDEYYAGYTEIVSNADGYLFRKSEMKEDRLVKDGKLYMWLGGDKAEVGTKDDGITQIGEGALFGVHEVTFGENITSIDGNLFARWSVGMNEKADNYKYTFLGAVPERNNDSNFFPNVFEVEGDTLEIKVKIDHVTEYKEAFNKGYHAFTPVGGETALVEEGKLIAWFGGDTAVVGTADDKITVIGEEALYGVENVTIGANIQAIEGYGLMGDLYGRVYHASLTFTGDIPAFNGSIGCPVSVEKGSTFVINIPEQYVQKYANSGKLWDSWKYVKIDTEDEFTVIDGTLYKYNGNDTKVHLPASVRNVHRGALPENMTELHFSRPETYNWVDTIDLQLSSDRLDIYIPNGHISIPNGDSFDDQYVRWRVYVRFFTTNDMVINADKNGTVTYHVDTTDSTALKYYGDMCAEMSKDSVYTRYEAEAWEVSANA